MSDKRRSIRVDGLGILLLGLAAVLAMLLAFAAQWAPEALPVSCDDLCLARRDLVAQNGMAAAAWGMLAIAVFSAIVGIVTVVFLAMTIFEARQATAVNRDIGQTQARAYLSAESAILRPSDFPFNVGITIAVRNAGQSPGRNLQAAIRLTAKSIWADADGEVTEDVEMEKALDLPIHDISAGQLVPFEFTIYTGWDERTLPAIVEQNMHVAIEIAFELSYTDVFGDVDLERAIFRKAVYNAQQVNDALSLPRVVN